MSAINKLMEALQAASDHLDYCGYGDSWERECAQSQGLKAKISAALAAGKEEIDEDEIRDLM